jgi:hypothetical protein
MSNRALAVVGFVIFTIVFIYEAEALKDGLGRIAFTNQSGPAVVTSPSPSVAALERYLFMVYSELSHANNLTAESLKKSHPELAPEIRYLEFTHLIPQIRSTRGFLKFRPLREAFKEDYEVLKTRYLAEHPGEEIPE